MVNAIEESAAGISAPGVGRFAPVREGGEVFHEVTGEPRSVKAKLDFICDEQSKRVLGERTHKRTLY